MLFCKRSHDPYMGLYNFVGGKVEPGEDGLHAAYREMNEETGITKDDISLTHMIDFTYLLGGCVVETYVGRLSKEVTLVEEAHPLLWLPLVGEDFFSLSSFAGEGSIGYMVELVKYHWKQLFNENRYSSS